MIKTKQKQTKKLAFKTDTLSTVHVQQEKQNVIKDL